MDDVFFWLLQIITVVSWKIENTSYKTKVVHPNVYSSKLENWKHIIKKKVVHPNVYSSKLENCKTSYKTKVVHPIFDSSKLENWKNII